MIVGLFGLIIGILVASGGIGTFITSWEILKDEYENRKKRG